MKLDDQLTGYMEVTDPEKRLTYSNYSKYLIDHGIKPITSKEWDMLIDVLGDRQMTSTVCEEQWKANIIASFYKGD